MLFVCGQITGLILVITKYKIKKKKDEWKELWM